MLAVSLSWSRNGHVSPRDGGACSDPGRPGASSTRHGQYVLPRDADRAEWPSQHGRPVDITGHMDARLCASHVFDVVAHDDCNDATERSTHGAVARRDY